MTTEALRGRLVSVDVLRGLTIGFMIMVNNNGDGAHAYWAMRHAEWNGFSPTDLVFPTFLFLVGVTTVFSLASRMAKGASKRTLFLHAVRRAAILYLLGLVVNSFPFFRLSTMRYYGVLPRIAICYLVVAGLFIFSQGWRGKVALLVGCLVGYWVLLRWVPVPGFGVPTVEVPLLDPDGNLTAWLDRQVFSAAHLYEGTRDPEGLLSTIPAVGTALLGVLAGIWLRSSRTVVEKARGIAIAGLSCLLLGGLWSFVFPINKKLWTSSFVLWAGGWSLVLLAVAIFLLDRVPGVVERPRRGLTPFLVLGTNAIAAYVFSELLAPILWVVQVGPGLSLKQAVFGSLLRVTPDRAFASLVYSVAFLGVCWLFVYSLWRRRIFVRI